MYAIRSYYVPVVLARQQLRFRQLLIDTGNPGIRACKQSRVQRVQFLVFASVIALDSGVDIAQHDPAVTHICTDQIKTGRTQANQAVDQVEAMTLKLRNNFV